MAEDESDKKSGPAKVVKVQPYPIECTFDTQEGQAPLECQIIRLEGFGFMFRSIGHFYRLNEEYTCNFEIPVTKHLIREVVKVVKTTESLEAYLPKGNKEKVMLVEVHFKNQKHDGRKSIERFMLKIGQRSLQGSKPS